MLLHADGGPVPALLLKLDERVVVGRVEQFGVELESLEPVLPRPLGLGPLLPCLLALLDPYSLPRRPLPPDLATPQ